MRILSLLIFDRSPGRIYDFQFFLKMEKMNATVKLTISTPNKIWSNSNSESYDGVAQEPLLWDYFEYPELFLVDYKFCTR